MAESHSLEELGRKLAVVARGLLDNAERAIRKAALRGDQVVVTVTPVDTGRARANWIASTGEPAEGSPNPPPGPPSPQGSPQRDANGAAAAQTALEQAAGVVASYTLDAGSIFLTNNVPYITALDAGSSRQAPAGMTDAALVAIREVLERERLVEG